MTTKSPLKLAMIQGTELPTTMPVVVESSAQRIAWRRDRSNAVDERALIDEQISSAERTRDHQKSEAVRIRDARVNYADDAMNREYSDADSLCETTVSGLRNRQADLDRIITGLGAAIDASGEDKTDGVSE